MTANEILVREYDREFQLEIPPPRNRAAGSLWKRLTRMDSWIPSSREHEKAQFFMAVTAAANRMPDDVTPESLTRAAFNAAALGLMPDTVHAYCHFVPLMRDRGKANERREVELWIGYRGFLELAFACGFLSSLTTEVVIKGEKCERWNDSAGAQIRHEIPLDRPEGVKIGDIEASYMIYKTRDGSTDVEMTSGRTLRALAKRQGNVWHSDPVAMSRKTPIRRGAKRWRINGAAGRHLAGAIALDEQAEIGKMQSLLLPEDPAAPPPEETTSGEAIDLGQLGLTTGDQLDAEANA